MSKPINEPRMVQQALVSDEDLSFELAALVPTANGITNAASTFIDKATKLLAVRQDHTHQRAAYGRHVGHHHRPTDRQGGAAVSKLLRNPDASADIIAGLRLTSKDRQDAR